MVSGQTVLEIEDFFTDFGKRVFRAITDMESSESGFVFSALNELFQPDEVGRMVRMQQDRERLQINDDTVLNAAVEALRQSRRKRESRQSGDWMAEIERRRAAMKKKQEK